MDICDKISRYKLMQDSPMGSLYTTEIASIYINDIITH